MEDFAFIFLIVSSAFGAIYFYQKDKKQTKVKTFIVYQSTVVNQVLNENGSNINMGTIVRKVNAETAEEALGKFILNTNNVEAKQKLTPEAIDLEQLKAID